jgi:hypothetical protein
VGDFFFKTPAEKMPDHPSRDPERAKAEEKGKSRLAKMKFADEGEKRQYEKAVEANPNNVMGLPPFFPALAIKSVFSRTDWTCEAHGHRPSNTKEKFCIVCFVDLPQTTTEPQAQEVT